MHYETYCGDITKILFWDGTGLCLSAKRPEQGRFRWPRIEDGTMHLMPSQLSALIEGLDWTWVRDATVSSGCPADRPNRRRLVGAVSPWTD